MKLKVLPILIFYISVTQLHAQMLPNQVIPEADARYHTIPIDSVVFIDFNLYPLFQPSQLVLISPSAAVPIYLISQGFPVYGNPDASYITGKYNYHLKEPFGFRQGSKNNKSPKPFKDLFYKEGDLGESQLSVFQWLPVKNRHTIHFGFNTLKTYPHYSKQQQKDQMLHINFHYNYELNAKNKFDVFFNYLRNVGWDFTGISPVTYTPADIVKIEDFSRQIGLAYSRGMFKLKYNFSNSQNRAGDILLIPKADGDLNEISRSYSLDYETHSIEGNWQIDSVTQAGISSDYSHAYKETAIRQFKHSMNKFYFNTRYKDIQGSFIVKKPDMLPVGFDINISAQKEFAMPRKIEVRAYYRSFMIPYLYRYLLNDHSERMNQWNKIAGLWLGFSSGFKKYFIINAYSWYNIPVDYHIMIYSGDPQKINDNYWGTGFDLGLIFKYFENYICYENFSPFGDQYIQRFSFKSRLYLKLTRNIRLTGFALLQYYPEYFRAQYLYTTNELNFMERDENPVISNFYITMPVKSTILYAAWSNTFMQYYNFRNNDYFNFITFKFGVIWRLWQ